MAASDGQVIIEIIVDTDKFKKGVKGVEKNLGGLQGVVKKITKQIAGVFAVKKILDFGKQCIDLGSDVQEVQNVVDTAFGDMAYKAEAFASTAITQFGMSSLAAKKTASNYMAMAKGMGVAEDAASDMAISLAGLTGDVASFYNLEQEEAAQKLAGVFTGEGEALKSIGVVMTETNLEAYALSQGITKQMKDMTQAEKVALRYGFVTNSLSLAQGDFAKTSDGWANQTRILSMQWQEFMSILGQALITVLRPVVKVLNQLVGYLITMANALNSFMTSIFGEAEAQTEKTATAASNALGAATEGQEDLTAATKETAKAQQKTIAGFDEINKLSSSGSGSDGKGKDSAAGGAFPAIDIATTTTPAQLTPTVDVTPFENLKQTLREISELFMSGFWKGFRDADFSGLKGQISSIKDSIVGIMADPSLQASMSGFTSSLIGSLGQIVGSIASVGMSIGKNLIGGIEKYLKQNSSFIKNSIAKVYDASSEIATSVANTFSAYANIFSVVASEKGQTLTANIIGIFGNAIYGVATLAAQLGADLVQLITQPLIDNQDGIKQIFSDFVGYFSEITGSIKLLVDELVEGVLALYEEHVKPLVDTITESLSRLVGEIIDAYNEHIKPVFDAFVEKFTAVVEEYVAPLIDKILEFVGSVIDIISWLWKNVLEPIVSFVIDILGPAFGAAFDFIGNVIVDAVKFISGLIDGIMDILNGIIDFVGGVFTGDWKRVWDGLKSIFTGLINGIISIFEGMINFIIDALNLFIGGLDAVVGFVGDIFGADWGIPEIPHVKIPRLAQGAVIPPNKEFMAVLGDQKSGTNIETPLATMVQAFKQALAESGGGGAQTIVLQIDGREFGRAVKKYGGREDQRIGVSLVGVKG